MNSNLLQHLIEVWQKFPEEEKIVDEERAVNLSSLLLEIATIKKEITTKHKDSGKNIGILLPGSISFISSFLGLMAAGKVPVPLNFLLTPRELATIIGHAECQLLLTCPEFKPLLQATAKFSATVFNTLTVDEILSDYSYPSSYLSPIAEELAGLEIKGEELACLIYTSGTQAAPKGVMLSHQNIIANYQSCRQWLEVSPEDNFLTILPPFHSYALTGSIILPLLNGSRIIMLKSFRSPDVMNAIQNYNISVLIMVPTMYCLLLRCKELFTARLPSLKYCISGGGFLPPAVEEAFQRTTGHKILNGYGLTETAPVISVNRPQDYKPGSIGKPLPNVEVAIRNELGQDLPPNDVGEITVRGPNVMLGYYKDEKETQEILKPDGWLATGDLGYLDEEGFLYICGRKKELIICAGENVFPEEIESVIAQHPAVEEAAVVGIKDKLRGEFPKAFVKLKENQTATVSELKQFCRENLAHFKIPRQFEFVADFPRSSIGKILKRMLVKE